eukprot:EG_transcript_26023
MGLACFPLSFSLLPSLPKVIDSLGCCAPLLCSTQFGHCQEEGPRQAFWGGCARLEGDYNSGRSGESIQQGDRPGRTPPWTTWDTLAVMTPKRRGYGGQSSPSSASNWMASQTQVTWLVWEAYDTIARSPVSCPRHSGQLPTSATGTLPHSGGRAVGQPIA